MLSISPIHRGGEGYYAKLGREDYYTKGGEPPLRAYGKGLEALGLSPGAAISPETLTQLLRGFSPDGRTCLYQNASCKGHHPGWDLTFSAPKAVSVAWSQAGPALRAAIEACHDKAVTAALDYVESIALRRVGKAGHELQPVAGLAFATAQHGVSREQEPQLHTHVITANAALCQDGTWRTVYGQPLFDAKMTAGALYRAELARRLQDLGFRVERDREFFTLPDVPAALAERFSTRRRQIKEALGAERADAKTSERAALLTRARKKAVPREELLQSWRAEGEKLGFDPEAIRHAPIRHRSLESGGKPVFAEALRDVVAEKSFFRSNELLRAMAELAPGTGLGSDEIRKLCSALLATSPEVVRLGVVDGKPLFTTRETLDTERRMLDYVRQLAKRKAPLLDDDARELAILETERKRGVTLSAEQRATVLHLTGREGSLHVLTGLAGTGKSSTLDAAKRAWEAQGYRVLGAALSGKAAEALHDASGIPSTTLKRLLLPTEERSFLQAYIAAQKAALRNILRGGFHSSASFLKYMELARKTGPPSVDSKVESMRDAYAAAKDASRRSFFGFRSANAFLRHMERVETRTLEIDERTVLVLDEASMVSTAQMAKLVEEVKKAGARLVLVGDPKQLQAIGQGGSFAAIAKEIGAADLSEIQRQREPWAREAVKNIATGEALATLREYAKRGLLHVAEDRKGAMQALVREWTRAGAPESPEKYLILTGTKAEAAQLNAMAQQARLERGALSYEGIQHGDETLREGDRVLFTRNSRLLDVKNGQLGTIEVADAARERLSVRLDAGRSIRFKLGEYEHLQLGYAATTHKVQGSTVDQDSFVLLGSMQDRELSYVQLSRARGRTWLFTDRLTAGDRITELAARMSRSHEKQLASEQVPEAGPQLGNYLEP